MNKRFRCAIAGWLLLMLCALYRPLDRPHIRYLPPLPARPEAKLPRQSGVSALLRHGVAQGNGRRYKFCRALITGECRSSRPGSACTAALILYVRQSRLRKRMLACGAAFCYVQYTSDKHLLQVLDGVIGQQVMASLENKTLPRFKLFLCVYPVLFTTGKASLTH